MDAKEWKDILESKEAHRLAMAAGVGAAAVPLSSGTQPAEAKEDKRSARYRLSDHIKAYYRVNRYPG